MLVPVARIAVVTVHAVVVLLASVILFLLLRNETPVIDDVERRFVAPAP